MISEGENEIPPTRNSSMACSISNDIIGLTDPSYEEKDTPGGSDTNNLRHSSPAFFVNMDNDADTGNSNAGQLKCPHYSTVSKSQSEIDIHIREKHRADEIAQ